MSGESYVTRRSERPERKSATHSNAAVWRGHPAGSFATSSSSSLSGSAAARSGNNVFPKQLLEILSDRNSLGVIEWLPHGHAFAIKNPDRFSTDIMPKFTRGKLTSFQRQLNLYGFRKVTKGPDCKAGALVYFHPAFKRGRPEMMHGIKRIACKGELSLNRLRNDDVPYDPNVPSEETDEPEQDVNSLKKPTRKRKRTWREDRVGKRTHGHEADEKPQHEKPQYDRHQHQYDRHEYEAQPVGPAEVSPGTNLSGKKVMLDIKAVNAVDAVRAVAPVRPAVAPSVDMKDLPVRSTDFNLHPTAMSKLSYVYPAYVSIPSPTYDAANRDRESGVSTPPSNTGISSDSNPNLQALLSQDSELLPRRMNIPLPKQYILQRELENMESLKQQESDSVAPLPKRLNLPPLRSHLTKTELEDLMPEPLSASVSASASTASMGVPRRPPSSFASMEPLMRTVSEVSGFSGASDLWHIDDLEADLDFSGLFD